jgi:hypothetical protein
MKLWDVAAVAWLRWMLRALLRFFVHAGDSGTVSCVASDEILLRRVPPSTQDFVTVRADGGIERPTSVTLRTRRNTSEQSLSCTRLKMTSPSELLGQLALGGSPMDASGWRVCCFLASDLLQLDDDGDGKLTVVHEPRIIPPVDLGHCGIYGSAGRPYPQAKGVSARLARIARMLTEEEVANTKAGGWLATSSERPPTL